MAFDIISYYRSYNSFTRAKGCIIGDTKQTVMAMGESYPTGPIEDLIRQMLNLQHFKNERKDYFEELTQREVEILSLIARGLRNSAVAQELGITPATVQNHRAKIRDKLNIQSQAEYIIYGLAYDLVEF